jgi:hypothetical protein
MEEFTPEVWSRMSNSIYQTEQFFGDVRPQRQVPNPNPITFPALITGYFLIEDTSNPTQEPDNPSRLFYYTWEEVGINATPTGLTASKFNGSRESGNSPSDPTFIPGINGAEYGQPTTRTSSLLGVNLERYPEEVAVMPSIHRASTVSSGATVDTAHNDARGPLVMLTLLRCTVDTNAKGSPDPDDQFRTIAMFYSSVNVDGPCDA